MVIRTTRDFSNSRPLDVHRRSDYPEVSTFIITPTQLIETLSLGGAFRSVITNCLKFHLSFEICKSKAFVDIVVSQQKQAILNIKTMIVPPIKLGTIS